MKKHATYISVLLAASMLVGCSPSTSFIKTGDTAPLAALPPNCEFNIFTTEPSKPYIELGLMEFTKTPVSAYGPRNVQEAKTLSQEYVCQAGGNGLLLWTVNGYGQYLKATVIKTQ
ncbi:MAG: hypothetical protein H7A09_04065 [Oceanospirillaceae bacterium]|nr:hypothetical protein [Oceanospirillaceae bacterium]MCP5335238.1 hypothetical protein [Oceanospirillaceae bacterium]